MLKNRVRVPLALLVTLVASGCSRDELTTPSTPPPTTAAPTTSTSSTTTTTTTTTSTSTTTTTTTLPAIVRQPLTGAPVAAETDITPRPALVVKIDNAPAARDHQSGLAVADIVFEEIVEGRLTRFAAVFHSAGSEIVGPVRSARSQDVDLLSSLGRPLFAWSGGNPGVRKLIAAAPFVDLNATRGEPKGYYRGKGKAPHNLYNSTETLWSLTPADGGAAPPAQFQYLRPENAFIGEPTSGFNLAMGRIDVSWQWRPDEHKFVRFQGGQPHVDVVHGPIGAQNVVVLGTEYRPSTVDARSPEAQTIAADAPVWVFSDGKVQKGRWSRAQATDPMRLVDDAGAPILLNPGQTWVELAMAQPGDDPANPGVELEIVGLQSATEPATTEAATTEAATTVAVTPVATTAAPDQ